MKINKYLCIAASVILSLLFIAGCSTAQGADSTRDATDGTQNSGSNTSQDTQTSSISNETPVPVTTVTQPVKAEFKLAQFDELFTWYGSEYLDLQFILTPEWRVFTNDSNYDLYGGFDGDTLKPYGTIENNNDITLDVLIKSRFGETSIAILFERITGADYPLVSDYFAWLETELKELESSSEITISPSTCKIGGNEWHQLSVKYSKDGQRFTQEYYFNMKDGYNRIIIITRHITDGERLSLQQLTDMFYAYDATPAEPPVTQPEAFIGTWEAENGLTREFRRDGTGTSYTSSDSVEFTWGVAGQYGLFMDFPTLFAKPIYFEITSDTLSIATAFNDYVMDEYKRVN